MQDPKDLKEAQEQLLDKERLQKGSRSLLNAINYIEKSHSSEIHSNLDLIKNAL